MSFDRGDYTVHAIIGVDAKSRMFLVDLWRKQAIPANGSMPIATWCGKLKPAFWAHEHTSIISGIGPFLERRSIEPQAWTYREQFPTRCDKAVRAQSIRGRMSLSGLYVPAAASWLSDLRIELLPFPYGQHDDMVDAL